LIDTPGFNDTKKNYGRSDAVILSEIARLIAAKSALGIKMVSSAPCASIQIDNFAQRGVIYLHDINLPRMTGEAVRQLILLQKISGKQNWKSITFVTTKWPELAHQQKYNLGVREADLRREHWRIMIRNGAKVFRFTDTVESAEVIVRSLMQQDDVLFTIQQEMKQGQSLANTSAGKFVIEARQEDEKRHSEMSEELKNEAGNQRLSMDIASLQGSIKNRKNGEENLDEHVQAAVEHEIKIKVEEELKKNGRRPTLATIVQFLLTLGSFTANIVQSAIS